MKVEWSISNKGYYEFCAQSCASCGIATVSAMLQNDGFENERSAVLTKLASFLSDMGEVDIERLRVFLDRDSE